MFSGRSGDLTKRDSSAEHDAEPASDRANSDLGIRYRKQDVQRDANALGGSHQHRPCCGVATPAAQTLRHVSRRPSRQGGRDLRKRGLPVIGLAHAGRDRSEPAVRSKRVFTTRRRGLRCPPRPHCLQAPRKGDGLERDDDSCGAMALRGGDRDTGLRTTADVGGRRNPVIWESTKTRLCLVAAGNGRNKKRGVLLFAPVMAQGPGSSDAWLGARSSRSWASL